MYTHHSLLLYARAFKSSENIFKWYVSINKGVSDFWDHARAMFGPSWGHVRPGFISTLARAVEFVRLCQFGPRGMSIVFDFLTIRGPCLDHVMAIFSFVEFYLETS